MFYELVKRNHKAMPSYGKWVPRAIHYNTLTEQDLMNEIQANCSATRADVILVCGALFEALKNHLRDGDRVEIPELGTMKLEINGAAVDTPEEFSPDEHIRGVSLHVLPKSRKGVKELYADIPLIRK